MILVDWKTKLLRRLRFDIRNIKCVSGVLLVIHLQIYILIQVSYSYSVLETLKRLLCL